MRYPKIIFLDFDGVLNDQDWLLGMSDEDIMCPSEIHKMLDPDRVALLQGIVDATGAGIVLSTAWRRHYSLEHLRATLKKVGLNADVIGVTPSGSWRHLEIKQWLNDNRSRYGVEAFIILEDTHAMKDLEERTVRSRFAGVGITGEPGGLTPTLAAVAKVLLKGG